MTVTTIDFAVHSADSGKKVCEILNGKSFYRFRAHVSSYPCAGNERVYVSTEYPHGTDEERKAEMTEMVLSILADAAAGYSF